MGEAWSLAPESHGCLPDCMTLKGLKVPRKGPLKGRDFYALPTQPTGNAKH
jgi:hypothetical protein